MAEKFVIPIHGQDHCPGGPDPIPCLGSPWLVLVNGGQSLPGDNNQHESLFTEAYWDPKILTDPTGGGGVYFIESVDDGGGNDYWQLTVNREGWYDIEIVHSLDEVGSNAGADVFFKHELSFSGSAFDNDTPMGRAAPWEAAGAELLITPYISTWRRAWLPSSVGVIDVTLQQNSGVTKTVSGHLKLWYRAGMGGGTDNAGWDSAII